MAEGERSRERDRDLLRRFMEESSGRGDVALGDDSGEIELSLGLSLGGRFGTDPKDKRLVRSSSIAVLEMLPRDLDMAPQTASLPLIRTCSLPTETEEEWRKRKEIQSLRRLVAKRKRSEKQKINSQPQPQPFRDRIALASLLLDDDNNKQHQHQHPTEVEALATAFMFEGKFPENSNSTPPNGFSSSAAPASSPSQSLSPQPVVLPSWPPRSSTTAAADVANPNANGKSNNVSAAATVTLQASSQGSLGSQGSSSSGLSDLGSRNSMEAQKGAGSAGLGYEREQTDERRCSISKKQPQVEMEERNVMEEMPCVSTKGEGPNGRRIEGFLYKYRKGEEVRIVCVCHGSFLSPAEFVKHAGGGDVTHPLRHIVVNPASSSF